MENEDKKMGMSDSDNGKCEECMKHWHAHGHCPMCAMGGGWHCGHMGKFIILKIIVCLIILLTVLWVGIKIGELKVSYDLYRPNGVYMMRGINPEAWYGVAGGCLTTSTLSAPTK
ncbi:MAG: hypothetical protein M1334_01975 [Patescibacteria group bacterium]|nr:hypothetical protein [Patescibacteria group bacterium]